MIATPSSDDILERLKRVLPDNVGVDPSLLEPHARLTDIGIDSYSLIELVFVAEEEFQIRIPFEGLAVKTVGDIIGVIQNTIGSPAME